MTRLLLVVCAFLAALTAAAPAGSSRWWTLEEATAFVESPAGFQVVDRAQRDQPIYQIRFARPVVRGIGKPRLGSVVRRRLEWTRFTVQGTAHDLITDRDFAESLTFDAGGTNITGFVGAKPNTSQPAFPIRAAFYYAWYPDAWTEQGIYPFTWYHPSLGFYSSTDYRVIRAHLGALRYGNVDAGLYSWDPDAGGPRTTAFATYLAAARPTPFRWALYYEPEGYGDPTPKEIATDLAYIKSHFASKPAYLKVGGRFVVFVYGDAGDGCGMAQRWKQGNTVGAYISLKVFYGYTSCAGQPDSWHQYGVGWSVNPGEDTQLPYSFMIAPGFNARDNRAPTEPRDLTRWHTNIQDMVASGAPWQLVITFNEWPEGTAVESAAEWKSSSGHGAYLDALHALP